MQARRRWARSRSRKAWALPGTAPVTGIIILQQASVRFRARRARGQPASHHMPVPPRGSIANPASPGHCLPARTYFQLRCARPDSPLTGAAERSPTASSGPCSCCSSVRASLAASRISPGSSRGAAFDALPRVRLRGAPLARAPRVACTPGLLSTGFVAHLYASVCVLSVPVRKSACGSEVRSPVR